MQKIQFSKPFAIVLAEKGAGINDVQVMRVGKWSHPEYGDFEISKEDLKTFKKNFDENVRRIDLAVDYFHDSDKIAAGWFKEVYLSDDEQALFAKVDWTPEAMKKLSDREIRYFSPEFCFEYQDDETGKAYKNVLLGGGLTNRPFIKEMLPIAATEKVTKGDLMTLEEAKKKADELKVKLEEAEQKLGAAEKKMQDMMPAVDEKDKLIAELQAKIAELEGKLKEHADKMQMAEKKAAFAKLMSEGKAVAAQEEAFIAGDLAKFAELSQKVNLEGKGHGGSDGTTGDVEDEIHTLAEAKRKENPKLSYIDAVKKVLAEKPELAAKRKK